jgi:hypothetical protein
MRIENEKKRNKPKEQHQKGSNATDHTEHGEQHPQRDGRVGENRARNEISGDQIKHEQGKELGVLGKQQH